MMVSHTSQAFYLPASARPNLTVVVLAHVHSVVTEEAENGNLTAVGVTFQVDGEVYTANASKEVILSCG